MLEIKAAGWQKEDDKLVQKKLNWDLAEWESNQNSKGFLFTLTIRLKQAPKPLNSV